MTFFWNFWNIYIRKPAFLKVYTWKVREAAENAFRLLKVFKEKEIAASNLDRITILI